MAIGFRNAIGATVVSAIAVLCSSASDTPLRVTLDVAQGENTLIAPTADVLAGRKLSDFICRDATMKAVGETFSLTNGVLTANASHALVLESPDRYDCENFLMQAEVRYESDGFADSGLERQLQNLF